MLSFKKHQGIKLSQSFSVSFSKELICAFAAVIIFHLLFFAVIDIEQAGKTPSFTKKALTVTLDYEDSSDTMMPKKKSSELIAENLMTFLSQSVSPVYRTRELVYQGPYFKEGVIPKHIWEEALFPVPKFASRPRVYPEVCCRLIGSFYDRVSLSTEERAWSDKATRFKCLYEIGIEGKSGKVVYMRLKDEDVPSRIAKKAEEYLLSLQFSMLENVMVKMHAEIIVTKENP